MTILLNPNAGGGTAVRKFRAIESEFQSRRGPFVLAFAQSAGEARSIIAGGFASGEREFVAAGGDGTVNALVTSIMTSVPELQRGSVAVGGVGLGSRNGFHKPLSEGGVVSGIPWKTDFSSTRLRDVVSIDLDGDGPAHRRYFLINASAGITAEAVRIVDSSDPFLATMKRISPSAAILYAGFRAIAEFHNCRLTVESPGSPGLDALVTNLAILKSPHLSGGLRYPFDADYGSGLLQFHLSWGLGMKGRVRLLRTLASGGAPHERCMRAWSSRRGELSANSPFVFEFDGEVVATTRVRLNVLPRHLRVCTC